VSKFLLVSENTVYKEIRCKGMIWPALDSERIVIPSHSGYWLPRKSGRRENYTEGH
jgi:hypothetical protein